MCFSFFFHPSYWILWDMNNPFSARFSPWTQQKAGSKAWGIVDGLPRVYPMYYIDTVHGYEILHHQKDGFQTCWNPNKMLRDFSKFFYHRSIGDSDFAPSARQSSYVQTSLDCQAECQNVTWCRPSDRGVFGGGKNHGKTGGKSHETDVETPWKAMVSLGKSIKKGWVFQIYVSLQEGILMAGWWFLKWLFKDGKIEGIQRDGQIRKGFKDLPLQ